MASRGIETGSPAAASTSTDAPNLLARIARGDESAVSECLAKHGPLVWSIVRRLAPPGADRESLTQDIFVELWRVAERFDSKLASERTFIAVIARRKVIDRRRKSERRRPTSSLEVDVESDQPSVETTVELRDEAAQAANALAELRPEQRKVLELAIYKGLTHSEIASATGIALGTVKTHARRGLIRVRELLASRE